ncbi:PLP-dependent aminotransferase family protein [Pacificibacter marinus]|uniref:aminotransferase-like domain-containing protein n=1 Tax=Pacificibacter marinus TaxID=658057 RepID=UPI001C070A9A|nr:PLP-dependent aminotransferase family protein [Pacificibacter marinus]MBU2865479.1 PLP-dependent aminotransferase family protein [Pacificibacter marinus]
MQKLPFSIDRNSAEPLQRQLRRAFIDAIHDGQMVVGQKIPSSRALAEQLGIARNTATAVYDELIARGYLESQARRGCFVSARGAEQDENTAKPSTLDWNARMRVHPSRFNHIRKPLNWKDYSYPFIYGQVDPRLFPVNAWRAASRDTLGRASIDWWAADRAVDDDPMLIEQIRTRILPDRGIYARPEEILITLGAQEGFYLLARMLSGPGARVGCEDPGYPDSRFIYELYGGQSVPLPIDAQGARIAPGLGLDVALLTPGAQCPTMTLMTDARRDQILNLAAQEDFLIVEDDYEGEVSFARDTALKARDKDGRVLYLGTLSKVLAPGVRLGFMVAPPEVVQEARWLRRLMHRSVPLNNQRAAAIFLAEGHYLALVRKLRKVHAERWYRVMEHIDTLMPGFKVPDPCQGGASVWLECPEGVDGRDLMREAMKAGVLFESGDPFVRSEDAGRFLRLGLSLIETDAIVPGMRVLGEVAARLAQAAPTVAP